MSDRQANRKLEEGFEYLQRGGFEQDGFTVWPLITPEKVGELLRYWKKTPEREAYLAALKAARSARRGRVDKNG